MISGIVLGLFCVALVATLGLTLVSKPNTFRAGLGQALASAWRFHMRGLLALVSLALVGLGLIICVSSRSANAWHTFFAWLITYFVGLNVYFVVRYAPWFKVKYMLQSLFKK